MIKSLLLTVSLFLGIVGFGQNILSGTVSDKSTGEAIIGVVVFDSLSSKAVITNEQGVFSMNIGDKKSVELTFKMIGFERKTQLVKASEEALNIELTANKTLSKVDVTYNRPIENRIEIGVTKIPIHQIKKLPSVSGELDVLRAYQLKPGVSEGKEGTSGIYVRGGSPDQNMFLMDDIPLYYVSHVGGFISVFDVNAINDFKLYKGGFPSKYSGRISSVMDFRMKDGNTKKLKGEVGVGVISTKLFIEGPIKKDTTSFFISLRRSNLDLFTRPFTSLATSGAASSGYTFYDVNFKMSHKTKKGGKIQTSGYFGNDKIFINSNVRDVVNNFKYELDNDIKWGNMMAQVKYIHPLSKRLFNTTTLGITRFRYNSQVSAIQKVISSNEVKSESSVDFSSSVFDLVGRSDFQFQHSSNLKFDFGLSFINHFFKPGITSNFNSDSNPIETKSFVSQDASVYGQMEFRIGKRISGNVGLNMSGYFVEGQSFFNLQPRAILSWRLHETGAVKAGYSRMVQSVHLLSNSGTGLPTDLWVPATKNLAPEIGDQLNLSYVQSIGKSLEFSIEGYWKKLYNLVDYKDGSNFIDIDENWESTISGGGKGDVKGVEILLEKKGGAIEGWIAYTLSKNTRQFEDINGGQIFDYKYDRRHDVSLACIYHINERISLSGTWSYRTGNPITLAQAQYNVLVPGYTWGGTSQGSLTSNLQVADIYEGKNAYRLSDYHRLDIGITLEKKKKKGLRTWRFGIYNVYNQQNPFFLYFKNIEGQAKLYQLSLFPIIPSVGYTFRFD